MPRKESTVSFKADEELLEALEGVPNRSEFIRHAVLIALDSRCPLCRGTGILTQEQKVHWEEFSQRHRIEECVDCHAWHLVCEADSHPPSNS